MEPITAVALSLALGAGAIAGKEVVSAVVKDAYTALKDLIKSRYPKASQLEQAPGSKNRRAVVEEDLTVSSAGQDTELIAAAHKLIELIQQHQPAAASALGIDLKEIAAANLRLTDIAVHAQTINIRDVKVGPTVDELVAALDAKGVLSASKLAGLQEHTIISLARRLKPEVLDFEQALTELERAVEVALDVIARGERGTNEDAFVNAVLAQVAAKVRKDDFDGGAHAIDQALAELEAKHRRSQVVLLEEGVKVDTLRRDALAVARRIEMIVAVGHPTDRPAWLPEFRARYDALYVDGDDKGINFSLLVAIELARRMEVAAHDADRRGVALHLFGNALRILGVRESGTARLEEAVAAYRGALKERTRERVPLQWAMTQNNLGSALQILGERESGTARLHEAVSAYGNALTERTRERVPLDWATSFGNQGVTLMLLAQRTQDAAIAERAFRQIEATFKTTHVGEHAPKATYYEARLPGARRILDALRVP